MRTESDGLRELIDGFVVFVRVLKFHATLQVSTILFLPPEVTPGQGRSQNDQTDSARRDPDAEEATGW